ncbi:MAG TPA: TauD/TfdA family dioxygenase [Polyangiales bacterium]|nr:TauD/TfdA family dioxygenase [Polyangiales bacterium]
MAIKALPVSVPASAPFPETLCGAGDLPAWVRRELSRLHAALLRSGAVLLRGFALQDPAQFAEAAELIAGPLDVEYEGPSPRTALGAPGVYTASEVTGKVAIAEHAELSYMPTMPRHVFFWCRQPAAFLGGTTIVDGRRVLARLDPERIASLRAGLRIRRRHARAVGPHDPFELKRWTLGFGQTREAALERARALGFHARFERDGSLTLEHTQPALRVHPETGEEAWLNHLLVFHASAPAAVLDQPLASPALRRLAQLYRAAMPRLGREVASDVSLPDGTPIDDETVAHVREAIIDETVAVRWRAGDLLIVDNHIALHGRQPYRGAREVIAAWSKARA